MRTTLGLLAAGLALGAPFVLPAFELGLLAMWLPLVILAIAIDLLWGENRIISFGHAAFFAGGAYLAGLLLRGPAADATATNLALLDADATGRSFDTIVETLAAPSVVGIPVLAFVLPVVLCGSAGWLIGHVIFRLGSAEIYAPLITLGISVLAATMYLRTSEIGGSNGLSGVPGYTQNLTTDSETGNYLFNVVWVIVIYAGYAWFRSSRWGRLWRAAGDDPIRLEALGLPVARIRTAGFAASTALAGLAGAIYVGSSGFVSADLAGVSFSVQALIWVAVGGAGTLAGPLLGVFAVQLGGHYLSDWIDYYWQLLLGLGLLTLVTLVPRGLAGIRVRPARVTRARARESR